MRGISPMEAAEAGGGLTYGQMEELSEESMRALLEVLAANQDSAFDLADVDWLNHHPDATQDDIDRYVANKLSGSGDYYEGQI